MPRVELGCVLYHCTTMPLQVQPLLLGTCCGTGTAHMLFSPHSLVRGTIIILQTIQIRKPMQRVFQHQQVWNQDSKPGHLAPMSMLHSLSGLILVRNGFTFHLKHSSMTTNSNVPGARQTKITSQYITLLQSQTGFH